ncbi:enoyl-CoA hydratase/isomerase family protein [Lipingzhangella halophila]|uniref:enoyl-CoA hydratase/isomerase family protein n=1 Tax=Lipingzhangella halophila TaxID=1783352 RepID=UPI00161EF634|nr:enoyl-CoA hydratase-related protein [Lipingzhangella halophila]
MTVNDHCRSNEVAPEQGTGADDRGRDRRGHRFRHQPHLQGWTTAWSFSATPALNCPANPAPPSNDSVRSTMTLAVEHFGHVTQLTLDRQEAANAVNVEMALGIAEAIDAFAADDNARVLVVTGAGERSFCAGGDLARLLELPGHAEADRAGPLGFARLDPGKPTIAAVNGHCFGGGMELALWCDFRIVAENAQFGALNRQWGVTLIDGGTQRLPRIVGYGNAMWMVNTGCRVSAERALQMGLAQELVPTGQAVSRAHEIAQEIADQPQPALLADRSGVAASAERSLQSGIDFEAIAGRAVMSDPDVVESLTEYNRRQTPPA